ncbi:hypothetical protein CGSSp9BS68_07282 [Streptococcus pneumoniae SP9-BS68]|nr:hypothetical protein CGSSp9BS68_07282 [Streptococcus pneumoniae SP9-BS68]
MFFLKTGVIFFFLFCFGQILIFKNFFPKLKEKNLSTSLIKNTFLFGYKFKKIFWEKIYELKWGNFH